MFKLHILSLLLYTGGIFKRPFLYAGLAVQSVYLLSRGIELHRLPLVGAHDTLAFIAASAAAFAIPFGTNLNWDSKYQKGTALLAAAFTMFSMFSKQHNIPLPPVLKTLWFELHVVTAFLSYALFGIAAVLGIIYLIEKIEKNEALQYKAILIGYCLFSASMIFGGVWAYLAWGTYWLWTPKELWTSILWLFYSLYLHARLRPWWAGRPSAILGIVGFVVVMFTYLGVSLLMKSSHSF